LTFIELLLYVLLKPVRGESGPGLGGGWSRVWEPLVCGEGGKETLVRDRDGDLRLGDLDDFTDEEAVVELERTERSRGGEMLESVEDMEGPSDGREPKMGRSGRGGSGSCSVGESRPLPFLVGMGAASGPVPKNVEPSSALVFGAELTRRRNRAAAEVAVFC
jgi:hypothetical protein